MQAGITYSLATETIRSELRPRVARGLTLQGAARMWRLRAAAYRALGGEAANFGTKVSRGYAWTASSGRLDTATRAPGSLRGAAKVGGPAAAIVNFGFDTFTTEYTLEQRVGRATLVGVSGAVGAVAGTAVAGVCTGGSFGFGAPVCGVAGFAVGTGVQMGTQQLLSPLSEALGWGEL